MGSRRRSAVGSSTGVLALALLAGCGGVPPTIATTVRADFWTLERGQWLRAHCALVATEVRRAADHRLPPPWGPPSNYHLVLTTTELGYGSLAYACAEEPPWPASNPQAVAATLDTIRGRGGPSCASPGEREAAQEALRLLSDEEGTVFPVFHEEDQKAQVVEPGAGEPASPNGFARIRLRLVRAKPLAGNLFRYHGRVGSTAAKRTSGDPLAWRIDPGPKAGVLVDVDSPPIVEVNHVSCLDATWGGAVSKLRVGGKARVENGSPDYGGVWEIELLAVGGEEIVKKHLGL